MRLSLVRSALVQRRFPALVLTVALGTGVAACGGGSGDVVGPPTPTPVASVTLDRTTASIAVGGTVTLTATPRDASGNTLTGRSITWSSNDTTVATVNAGGTVTGKAAGTAKVTATSEGQSASATITVTPAPVASVTLDRTSAAIAAGSSVTLTATTKDAAGTVLTGRAVTWSSSNTAVATVDQNGVVTGKTVGTDTVTATSEGKTAQAVITVNPGAVASVTVAPTSASVLAGMFDTTLVRVALTATAKDVAGNTVSGQSVAWTSSDTTIARVDASGVVHGYNTGTVTITATVGGQKGTSTVTVTRPAVATITVVPDTSTIRVGQSETFSVALQDAQGRYLDGRFCAAGTDTAGASVIDVAGTTVTGKAQGTANWIIQCEGVQATSRVTVTP